MGTQNLTIQLGLDGLGRVTGGLRSVSAVAKASLGGLSRYVLPVAGLAATAVGLRSVAGGLSEVIDAGGKLTDVSAATGVAIDRLVRFRQVFEEAGKSADAVTPAFAKMQKAVYQAATEGGSAAEAIARLGLDIGKLTQMRPDEQFDTMARAIGSIENPTQRAGVVMEVFGKSATELLAVFEALGDSGRTDRALGRLPEILARNAKVLDAIGDGFSQLKLKGQQFFAGILDQTAPMIDQIVQGFAAIDLTGAGQRVGAFVNIALDAWREGKFGEFIGLTIEAGFELGAVAARRVFRELGSGEFWVAITNGLVTAVNLGMKGAVLGLVWLSEQAGRSFIALSETFAEGMVAAINFVGRKLEDVINAEIKAINVLFGKSFGLVSIPSVRVQTEGYDSLRRGLAENAQGLRDAAGAFFDQSTTSARSLLGISPSGDEMAAVNAIAERMREILENREKAALAEKTVVSGISAQMPLVSQMKLLRQEEAAAMARLADLERQRAMIEGDFRLNDAQKYQAKLALLRQERAEIERILALLRERSLAPGLTEQEREQIGQRIDGFQGRLGAVNTSIGTVGPDPNSVGEQMTASITGLENQFGTTAQAIARSFTSVIGTAVDSVSGGLQRLIGDTEYWSAKLGKIAGPIMGAVTAAISRMFTEWIAKRALLAVKNMFWSAKEGATDAAAKAPGALLTSISSWGVAAGVGLAAIIAAVAAFGGFRSGGYTGDMGEGQVAGVVHGREFVFDAPAVSRIGVENLERLRAGQPLVSNTPASTAGSSSGAQVSIASFDSRQDARRWAQSQEAEVWFVDMAKRTANRWSAA